MPVEPGTDPRSLRWWWIPDLAFAALRVSIALLIVRHGAQEHLGMFLGPGQRWGGPLAPFSDPWILASVRLAGGALLAVGLFTQGAALVLAALVTLTHLVANGTDAHWLRNGGELALLYLIILLAFAFIGPGLFSMDVLFRGRTRRRPSGMTVEMSPWVRRQYRRRELRR